MKLIHKYVRAFTSAARLNLIKGHNLITYELTLICSFYIHRETAGDHVEV